MMNLTLAGTIELTIVDPIDVINPTIEHIRMDVNGFSINKFLSLHE